MVQIRQLRSVEGPVQRSTKDCQNRTWTILKLTVWLRGTNSSTLERDRTCAEECHIISKPHPRGRQRLPTAKVNVSQQLWIQQLWRVNNFGNNFRLCKVLREALAEPEGGRGGRGGREGWRGGGRGGRRGGSWQKSKVNRPTAFDFFVKVGVAVT